jgi:hypothetical protein
MTNSNLVGCWVGGSAGSLSNDNTLFTMRTLNPFLQTLSTLNLAHTFTAWSCLEEKLPPTVQASGVSVNSKRMNTARIVVLTIAPGAGGAAAYLASGSDFMAASLPTGVRAISTEISPETGTQSPALRSIADRNAIETSSEHQSSKRGDSVNVAHYGVSTPTKTPK